MTKKIRIENADNNTSHKVRVFIEYRTGDGWVRDVNSAKPVDLLNPTDLAELWVHGSQRLVVEETSE